MKKISIKRMAFIASVILITGFSGYALANMGFGSHMGGYGANGYHMNGFNGYNGDHMGGGTGYSGMGSGQHMYNGNHMYNSGQMGSGMYTDGQMSGNGYYQGQNQMDNDRFRLNNNYMQRDSNNRPESYQKNNR